MENNYYRMDRGRSLLVIIGLSALGWTILCVIGIMLGIHP
jgi:hypothetical protein